MTGMIRRGAGLLFSALAFAACSDSSGTGTGMLTVRLTDAPFPFSDVASVQVYIVRVDAKAAMAFHAGEYHLYLSVEFQRPPQARLFFRPRSDQ